MVQSETFIDRLVHAIQEKRSVLCVGIDPQFDSIPEPLKREAISRYGKTLRAIRHLFEEFAKRIIHAVEFDAVAVKPNWGFFVGYGYHGFRAYQNILQYAQRQGLIVIADGKPGDGPPTAQYYAKGFLGEMPFWPDGDGRPTTIRSPIRADAMTAQVELGEPWWDALRDEVVATGRGAFLMLRSSFRGGWSGHESSIQRHTTISAEPWWEQFAQSHMKKICADTAGKTGWYNVGAVVGATFPREAETIRKILPKVWFLTPGLGDQKATADDAVAGVDDQGLGVLAAPSRSVIYAYMREGFIRPPEEFAQAAAAAARVARDALNMAIQRRLHDRKNATVR
ncbi:orotidine-5'-phosphate decarboxylase [Candidatus Parcubacteria bacterium]|nr:MAG: orotidine-5'-phosphate decarboxylase [Candidatus Parcubacteria bacterium]